MKALKIIRNILLWLLFPVVVIAIVMAVFSYKLPIWVNIPEAEQYTKVDRGDFIVATNGIEDARNATVVYESTDKELEYYGQELRYISGRIEPLTSQVPMARDIPTDVISGGSSYSTNTYTQTVSEEPVDSEEPVLEDSELD